MLSAAEHYYALHKPKGVTVEQASPATGGKGGRRRTLNDWISSLPTPADPARRISAVGRLDKDTSGLLLLTDDGKLNERVLRPGILPKKYEATVKLRVPATPSDEQLRKLTDGVQLSDGVARVLEASVIGQVKLVRPEQQALSSGPRNHKKRRRKIASAKHDSAKHDNAQHDTAAGTTNESALSTAALGDSTLSELIDSAATPAEDAPPHIPDVHAFVLRLRLSLGRNRVVRRMLAAVGLPVYELRRVRFGPLGLEELGLHEPGMIRELSPDQVHCLRSACGDAAPARCESLAADDDEDESLENRS